MSVAQSLADLLDRLSPDPERLSSGFSHDLELKHRDLFNPQRTLQQKQNDLLTWLHSQSQLCPFGRTAAKQDDKYPEGRLVLCLLDEDDLRSGESVVKRKIQLARKNWRELAARGRAFGFLLALISPDYAQSIPNDVCKAIADRLLSLCLDGADAAGPYVRDRVALGVEDGRQVSWLASISYFSAQADGRWWNDRRIPGGMAFSINSVGHMVTSMFVREPTSDVARRDKLVYSALPLAMQTIRLAWLENGDVGRPKPLHGTELVPRDGSDGLAPNFHTDGRFKDLKVYSENRYAGLYDTDVTLPPYFFDKKNHATGKADFNNLSFAYMHSSDTDKDYREFGLGELTGNQRELVDSVTKEVLDDSAQSSSAREN